MSSLQQSIDQIDYRQAQASDEIVPHLAVVKSLGWSGIHFELHHQPIFATAEHQHTMHVLACGVSPTSVAPGHRRLEGKLQRERRNPGDIAIIPAGIAHGCSWDTSAQFMILALEPLLLSQMAADSVKADQIELIPHFMSQSDVFVQTIVSTLGQEAASSHTASGIDDLFIDSLKTALAIHLLRNYCTVHPTVSTATLSQTQLASVTDYINDHLDRNLQLPEIAAIAQVSPYHFLRLFKQKLGVTPHQYILQRRIDKAKRLLTSTELTIAEIAVQTGFCDQSHLTRHFKRKVGVTPRGLRTRSQ